MPEQPKKRKVGRPSKYKPEFCQMIIDHFDLEVEDYANGSRQFPTFIDFAHKIGVCDETLQEWCRSKPEFSASYKKAKKLLEAFFIKAGMENKLNTTFAIFYSKNCLGWKDKQEVDQTVNLAGSLNINIVRNKDGNNAQHTSDSSDS